LHLKLCFQLVPCGIGKHRKLEFAAQVRSQTEFGNEEEWGRAKSGNEEEAESGNEEERGRAELVRKNEGEETMAETTVNERRATMFG